MFTIFGGLRAQAGIVPQTIVFAPVPPHVFGDAPFSVISTSSSGLPVSLSVTSGPATVSGGTVTITGAGPVVLQATQAGDATYAAATTVTQSFTVEKATATVTLSNLAQSFDGNAKSVIVATTPDALALNVTYNGSTIVPSAAGAYVIAVTIDNPNYYGAAAGILIIGAGAQSISFGGVPIPSHIFGDVPFTVAPTASSGLPVTLSVVSGPATVLGSTVTITGAGTVVLQASQAGNGNFAATNLTQSFVVAKAIVPVTLNGLAQAFGGTPKTVTATTTPPGLAVDLTYGGVALAPSAAGSYAVVATVNDPDYAGLASGILTIGAGAQSVSFGTGIADHTFGDPPFTVSATSTSGLPVTLSVANGPATVSGNTVALTGAGVVTLEISQSGNGAFLPTIATQDFNVAKAPAVVSLGNLAQLFDGTAKSVSVTTIPAGLAVDLTYNGSVVAPSTEGSYLVTVSVTDPNYQGSAGGVLTIGAGGQAITFLPIASHTFGDAPFSVGPVTSSGLPVTLSVTSGPATVSDNTVTITGAGTVVLQASQAGNGAYQAASVTQTFTVAKAPALVTLTGLAQSFDGTVKSVLPSTTPPGLAVNLTYNGSATAPSAAGSYAIAATVSDANYLGATAGTLTIGSGAQSITFPATSNHTFGDAPFTVSPTVDAGLPVVLSVTSGPATVSGNTVTLTGAGTVTLLATQAGNGSLLPASISQSFTVSPRGQTISFDAIPNQAFGSPPFAVSATAASGLPVTLSVVNGPAILSGNTVTLIGSGEVTLLATQAGNANFLPAMATQSFAIGTGAQTIAFAPIPSHTFGDASFAVSPAAESGLPVTLSVASGPATVSGHTVTITGVGTVVLQASQAGNGIFGPAPSVTQSFQVAKAPALVTLGNLAQSFDGTAKSVIASTIPAGVAVNLTYDGSATAPSAAGTYGIVAVVTDPNYQGSAGGVLTIGAGAQSVSLGGVPIPGHIFGDAPFTVTPTASSGLPVTLSVASGPATVAGNTVTIIGSGTVVLQASQAGDASHAATNVTQSFDVAKATAPVVLGNLAQTFDGAAKSVSAITAPPGLAVSVTYGGSASAPFAAGSYAVIATVNNANYQGVAGGTLTIGPGAQSISLGSVPISDHTFGDAAFTLNPASSSRLPVTLSVASGPATVSGNTVTITGAGTVTLAAMQSGNGLYLPTSITEEFSVAKAAATVALSGLAPSFDGTAKTATATTIPAGLSVNLTYNGSATAPSAAGNYAVLAEVIDSNYQGSAAGTFIIGTGGQTITFASIPAHAFGDSPFAVGPTASSSLPVTLAVEDGPATVTGSTVTITGPGTVVLRASQAGNGSFQPASITQSFTVAAAAPAVTFAPISQHTFGDRPFTAGTTLTSGSPTTLSVVSGPASVSGNIVTITGAGTVILQASQAASGGSAATSTTTTFIVAKATATIVLSGLSQIYDGSAKNVTATTTPPGLAVSLTYNGSTAAPSALGSYTALGSINDPNYEGLAEGTITIAEAAQSIAFGAIPNHVLGDAPFTVNPTASSGLPVVLSVASGPAVVTGNTIAITGVGTVILAASQAGNSIYAPASLTRSFVVSGGSNLAPAITRGPTNQTVAPGGTATFSVSVTGVPPPIYQWYFNGKVIPGATDATFTLANVQVANNGTYTVIATNAAGEVDSAAAGLTVSSSRIVNFSARAAIASGGPPLTLGFVVSAGKQTVLVRGVGPTLASFGIAGVLPAPRLTLFSGANPVATDSGWQNEGNAAQVAATTAQLGAFSLANGSSDSALVASLDGGPYTAQIDSPDNSSGIALAEVYDSNANLAVRLVNGSALAPVGTGQASFIAGFILAGTGPKTVLIRGVGPTLAQFGIKGLLTNPQISVYSGGTVIASNAGWGTGGNAAQVAAVLAPIGAFPLPGGSSDAALIVTLQPGAYTIQVTGTGNATGVALVELYEVP